MSLWDDLAAEFPRDAISWRSQSLTKDGDKALALAYIDARDVMRRLDEVVGPENWQDRYEVHGDKTICYLSIKVEQGSFEKPYEWVTKADGAGDTQVEAEKGSISDAFKRAAVKWGIGRYLYDIPAPWVPCETYESNGKTYWKSWKEDPWSCVRKPVTTSKTSPKQPKQKSVAERKAIWAQLMDDLNAEAPKGWKKMVEYMKHSDTLAAVEELGDYKDQFLNEARDLTKLVKAGEEATGEPVAKAMSRVLPNFDNMQSGDALDEMLQSQGEQE